MKRITILLFVAATLTASAQDDLLKMMENESPQETTPVYATFKSTRVINLQSNETMKAKHLDFRIQHRFGSFNNGAYDLFGMDGPASLRLGLEYGLTDKFMIGAGRTNVGKTYDGFVKWQLLQQTKGKKSFPVSMVYFGNMAINTLEWADPTRDNLFSSRLSFVNQVIITRKFNDYFSLAVTPTIVHHNLVQTTNTPNDIYAVGIGASVRITRSTRFNIEYIPRLNGRDDPKTAAGSATYYDSFAVGFDIETGGHVFQLHFTNASGMIEQQFITENPNKIDMNVLRFGFNISRTFSFDHKK